MVRHVFLPNSLTVKVQKLEQSHRLSQQQVRTGQIDNVLLNTTAKVERLSQQVYCKLFAFKRY